MKHIYALLFLTSFFGFGQCPTEDVVLSSQAEVDSFFMDYPDCTELEYGLTISGFDITDLTLLSGITSVHALFIIDNPQLVTLDGLQSLQNIDGFDENNFTYLTIWDNNNLESIAALSNLANLSDFEGIHLKNNLNLISLEGLGDLSQMQDIIIENNNALTNLVGLNQNIIGLDDLIVDNNDNLEYLWGINWFENAGTVEIINNASLTTLDGMNSYQGSLTLVISGNAVLSDISNLNNSELSGPSNELGLENLIITNNPNLSYCNISSICALIEADVDDSDLFEVTISDNAENCENVSIVETFCSVDCSNENITLTTQAEVDAFPDNYLGCNVFAQLSINGLDITDLTPLSQINSVEGFSIQNTGLTSLSGLQNVNVAVGPLGTLSFSINDNPNLISIQALGNIADNFAVDMMNIVNNPLLETLEGLEWINEGLELFIINNDSLTNLSGVGSIESLEVLIVRDCENFTNFEGLSENLTIFSDLLIDNNDSLVQLIGLEDIDISGIIDIRNNDNLLNINLNGLGASTGEFSSLFLENNLILNDISQIDPIAISSEFTELSIINNPNLSTCNTAFICSLLEENYDPNSFSFSITLENNGEDCNSITNLLYNCESVPVNDDCEDALFADIGEVILSYNQFGSESAYAPTCNNEGDIIDVWFTFNSGDSEALDITVDQGFSMQLWEGSCASLTPVANACSENVLNSIAVTEDTTYYLQIWSVANNLDRSGAGLFNLNIQEATLNLIEEEFSSFSVFPNPVNATLYFESANAIEAAELFNALGQPLKSIHPKSPSQYYMDMSGLSSGIYFLKVSTGEKENIYRIVKN